MFKKNIEGSPLTQSELSELYELGIIQNGRVRGILQCDNTFIGSIIGGKKSLTYFILLPSFIFFLIPWDTLFHTPIYSSFIEFMARFDPNIGKIKNGNIQFPEYAMSFVAFCDLIGPMVGLFYFIYGFIHPKYINLAIFRHISIIVKLFAIFGGSIFLFLIGLGVIYYWHGGAFLYFTWIHESKLLFITFIITLWFSLCGGCFFLSCFPISLWLTYKNR